MKTKVILVTLLTVVAALAAACGQEAPAERRASRTYQNTTQQRSARVPAFQDAQSAKNLRPTLPAEQFIGPTRDAYRIVKEIPETIAQLPCYCHCDMSFGHKSLYSCFEDNHASQCAVCVNEALIAYDLHKNGMAPAQIREYIVQQYSKQQ
ncbi:MAG TPA: CYCXC family (seleno)protein [Pyrinomonadaceae bacterium]|nr:CYCXC family (seleno)protein [Pyrinomonadaceae bacterium]